MGELFDAYQVQYYFLIFILVPLFTKNLNLIVVGSLLALNLLIFDIVTQICKVDYYLLAYGFELVNICLYGLLRNPKRFYSLSLLSLSSAMLNVSTYLENGLYWLIKDHYESFNMVLLEATLVLLCFNLHQAKDCKR